MINIMLLKRELFFLSEFFLGLKVILLKYWTAHPFYGCTWFRFFLSTHAAFELWLFYWCHESKLQGILQSIFIRYDHFFYGRLPEEVAGYL